MESISENVSKYVLEAPSLPVNYQCYASLKSLASILKRDDMEILLQEMQHSKFYPFLKQLHKLVQKDNKISLESSSVLMFCLGKRFNKIENKFTIGDVSISFCANEVASVLGIPNEGTNIDDEPSKTRKTEEAKDFFSRLQQHVHLKNGEKEGEEEKNKKRKTKGKEKKGKEKEGKEKFFSMSRHTLTDILRIMPVDVHDAESRKDFLKLFYYFLIEGFLLVSSDKTCRIKNYKYVQDLDRFEKINWASATLDGIHEAAKKVATSNSCFTGCSLVLEALLYEKVENMRPEVRKGEDTLLPILKYNSKRWIYETLWPKVHSLTIKDVSVSRSYC